LPLAPALIEIHVALSVAVHAQPVAAVTVTVLAVAVAATFAESGARVGAQGAPACVTVNVSSPMVNVPVRAEVVGFAVTLNVTDPLPVPLPPALIVIHVALLVAVQPQPEVTATVPLPADHATFADAGAILDTHGAPACVTVKVLPPTVSVPVRGAMAVFAATS
jgi:hypothetical protein